MASVSFTASNGTTHRYGYEACGALQQFLQNADGDAGANFQNCVNYLGGLTLPVISFLDEPRSLESVTSFPLIYIRPGAIRPSWETTRTVELEHDIRCRVFAAYTDTASATDGIGEAYMVASAIAALVMQTNYTDQVEEWASWYCNNGEPLAVVSDPGTIDHDTGTLVYVDVDITYRHCEAIQ